MFESFERRILFHTAFIQGGVLFLEGVDADDDVLVIEFTNGIYQARADNDGFSMNFAATQVTKGLNVSGMGGNDSITIGGGILLPTTLSGGDGNDTVNGGLGKDSITGDAGNDELLGNGGRDLIDGGDGNDTLSGGTKNDTLIGGVGADFFVGSAGALDAVDYSAELNGVSVSLNGLNDDGAPGEQDTIADTCEVFYGGNGDDHIVGSGKANILKGNNGDDTLIGGSGNDTIDGGTGSDTLQGQAGSDTILAKDSEIDSVSGGSGVDSADTDSKDVVDSVP